MTKPAWDVSLATSGVLSGPTPSYWLSISERIMRQAASSAGKQYEIDQVQTGEFDPTLSNEDAIFSPINTSSVLSPNVSAYRPMRWRAQYPPSANLLTGDQAALGDATPQAAGTLLTAIAMGSEYDPNASVFADATAWQGALVGTAQILVAAAPGSAVFFASQWSMHPNVQHSFSAYVRVPGGTSTVQLHPAIRWRDTNGSVILATIGSVATLPAASATWVRVTVTGTAPAAACGADVALVLDAAPSATATVETDGWQVELAAAPTAWVRPTWYSIFYGGTERWPQVYDMAGTYGKSKPVVVDSFAVLSQVYPLPAFYSDVLAMNPNFFFPLDDPTGAQAFRDLTGKHGPAPIGNSPYGAGTVAAGSGITATTATVGLAPNGAFFGAPGPIVTFTNPNTGSSSVGTANSFIDLTQTGISGTPPSGGWTRMLAFRNTGAGLGVGAAWNSGPAKFSGLSGLFYIAFGAGASPGIVVEVFGPTTGFVYNPVGPDYADGNWHLLFVSLNTAGTTLNIYCDGVNIYNSTVVGDQHTPANANKVDQLGSIAFSGDGQFYDGYNGDLALAAEFPSELTLTQVQNLTSSWRNGYLGDSTGARYQRILAYAGYGGPVSAQTGNTTSMGPMKDVDGNTSALTLLENVVTTENGVHYVRGDGTICFEQRANRYNKLIPSVTFGEKTALGEVPYEDVAFDFDTTHVVGLAQVTQFATSQVFSGYSPTTIAPNYRPTFQRTINVTSSQEAQDAAYFLASRYQAPTNRVRAIRLHPAAVPSMWPAALSLGISTRARVNRRSRGNPLIQFDGFVESMKPQIDFDTGDFVIDLEMSPFGLSQYWVAPALHTTLAAAATSGTNTITVAPFADGFANRPSCSMCAGLNMTLDPAGGATLAESLAVSLISGGVPLAPNSYFSTGTTANWSAFNVSTIAIVAGQYPQAGQNACQATSTVTTSATGLITAALITGITASSSYYFGALVNPSQTLSTVTFTVNWYNASSTFLSATSVSVPNTPAGWQTLRTQHTAPALATQASISIDGGLMPVGQTIAATNILFAPPVTIAFTTNLIHNHAVNAVACEQLPTNVSDPTLWDSSGIVGVTTVPSY